MITEKRHHSQHLKQAHLSGKKIAMNWLLYYKASQKMRAVLLSLSLFKLKLFEHLESRNTQMETFDYKKQMKRGCFFDCFKKDYETTG